MIRYTFFPYFSIISSFRLVNRPIKNLPQDLLYFMLCSFLELNEKVILVSLLYPIISYVLKQFLKQLSYDKRKLHNNRLVRKKKKKRKECVEERKRKH